LGWHCWALAWFWCGSSRHGLVSFLMSGTKRLTPRRIIRKRKNLSQSLLPHSKWGRHRLHDELPSKRQGRIGEVSRSKPAKVFQFVVRRSKPFLMMRRSVSVSCAGLFRKSLVLASKQLDTSYYLVCAKKLVS